MEQIPNTDSSKKTSSVYNSIYDWAESVVFAVVVVVLLFSFAFRVVTVNGTSMLPNYVENDKLIINELLNDFEQGDVVVIVSVLDDPIIKRVVAVEGQTVDIIDGNVYVDGVLFDDESYGITTDCTFTNATVEFPQTVPEGCVFVLGDNRMVSEDSRYSDVGMVNTEKVLGEVIFCIYPAEKIGTTE